MDRSSDGNPFSLVPIEITISVGRARPLVRELLSLDKDAVLTLDRRVEDPVELYIGDRRGGNWKRQRRFRHATTLHRRGRRRRARGVTTGGAGLVGRRARGVPGDGHAVTGTPDCRVCPALIVRGKLLFARYWTPRVNSSRRLPDAARRSPTRNYRIGCDELSAAWELAVG